MSKLIPFPNNRRPSAVERHMAKNRRILETIALNHVNETEFSVSKVAFHDEETVAIIYYVDNTIENCQLMEVE